MVDLHTFQIAVLLFTLFAVTRVLLRLQERTIRASAGLFWIGLWIVIIVIAFIPNFLSGAAQIAGLSRGVDLLVYMSVGLLFYLSFRNYVMVKNHEKRFSDAIIGVTVNTMPDHPSKKKSR